MTARNSMKGTDDPAAPLPDDDLPAIEARLDKFDDDESIHSDDYIFDVTVAELRTLLAALRAERAARERLREAAQAGLDQLDIEVELFPPRRPRPGHRRKRP